MFSVLNLATSLLNRKSLWKSRKIRSKLNSWRWQKLKFITCWVWRGYSLTSTSNIAELIIAEAVISLSYNKFIVVLKPPSKAKAHLTEWISMLYHDLLKKSWGVCTIGWVGATNNKTVVRPFRWITASLPSSDTTGLSGWAWSGAIQGSSNNLSQILAHINTRFSNKQACSTGSSVCWGEKITDAAHRSNDKTHRR